MKIINKSNIYNFIDKVGLECYNNSKANSPIIAMTKTPTLDNYTIVEKTIKEAYSKFQKGNKKEFIKLILLYEDNIKFMSYLVNNNTQLLPYCKKLLNNKDFVLEKISLNGNILEIVSEELKNDPEVVCAAIGKSILSIYYASPELKDNGMFIKDCINKIFKEKPMPECVYAGQLLKYASDKVKDDYEIISEITNILPYTIEYASDRIKNDKAIFAKIVQYHPFLIQFASEELRNEKELANLVMQADKSAFIYLSEELRNNKEYVLLALSHDGVILESASKEIRANKEMVLIAIENNNYAYKYAEESIKTDNEIIEKVLLKNEDMIEFVPKGYQKKYIKELLKKNPYVYKLLEEDLKYDYKIIAYVFECLLKKNTYFTKDNVEWKMIEMLPKDLQKEREQTNLNLEDYLEQLKFNEELEINVQNKYKAKVETPKNKKKI